MKGTVLFAWSPTMQRISGRGETIGAVTLAEWLSSEMQRSVSLIDDTIKWLSKITPDGWEGSYIRNGNAFDVMVVGEQVFVDREYMNDRQVLLNRDQVILILERYRDFVNSDIENPNFHAESIEVEYLAEGEEAAKRYAKAGGTWTIPTYEFRN
jgi:hypothetical protein